MFNFNDLVGNIKNIHNKTKTSEKVVDAMIVDYTFNPSLSIAKQHKIDYVTTSGIIGNMFINENTTFTDIEVSEHIEKYLLLIKESIIRKKEAYRVYQEENANIESLTVDLLREDKALSKDDFKKELTSKLKDNYIKYRGVDSYNGKTMFKYALNSSINIEVVLKKHFIHQIRIEVLKSTWKFLKDLDFINKDINKGRYLKVNNNEGYNSFIKDFSVFNFEDTKLKKFLEENQLEISTTNHLSLIDKEQEIEFSELTIFKPTDSDNILIFNDNSIELILEVIKFIK